jgi:hypothetical protein
VLSVRLAWDIANAAAPPRMKPNPWFPAGRAVNAPQAR